MDHADYARLSAWRQQRRAELTAMRGSVLLRGEWQSEREILDALDDDEAILSVTAGALEDPRSHGLVALTHRRLVYCGGRTYDFYVRATAGTYIARFIQRQRRVQVVVPLDRMQDVTKSSTSDHVMRLRYDHGVVLARSTPRMSARDFGAAVAAAIIAQLGNDEA